MLRLPVEAFSAVFTKYPESLVRVVQVSGRFTSLHDPRPSQAPGGWTQPPRGLTVGLSTLSSQTSSTPPLSRLHPISPGCCHLTVGFSLAPVALPSPFLL